MKAVIFWLRSDSELFRVRIGGPALGGRLRSVGRAIPPDVNTCKRRKHEGRAEFGGGCYVWWLLQFGGGCYVGWRLLRLVLLLRLVTATFGNGCYVW